MGPTETALKKIFNQTMYKKILIYMGVLSYPNTKFIKYLLEQMLLIAVYTSPNN